MRWEPLKALLISLMLPAAALAQADEPPDNSGGWVLPIALVACCIGLGLMAACHRSARVEASQNDFRDD